jgi:hypothetical protein
MNTSYEIGSVPLENISRLVYLNPFFDYSSVFQPTIWHNALRWCHLPTAKIEKDDGSIIEIKDVKIGDLIRGVRNTVIVTNVIRRKYSGKILKIKPFGLPLLTVTPDHELYIADRRRDPETANIISIPAFELRSTDWLVSSRFDLERFVELEKLVGDFDNFIVDLLDTNDYFEAKDFDDGKFIFKNEILRWFEGYDEDFILYNLMHIFDSIGLPAALEQNGIRIYDYYKQIKLSYWLPFVFRQIEFIEEDNYEGEVISITTEPDHDYVCECVGVKNCEYVVLTNGILRSSIDRIISFFITDIEIEGTNEIERKRYKECLYDNLNIVSVLRSLGFEFITYGNFFVSILASPKRILICPSCGFSVNILNAIDAIHLSFSNYAFHGTCPECKFIGEFNINDLWDQDPSKILIKRWRPYEITIEFDPFSEQLRYIWKIPQYYKECLNRGEPLVLANVSRDILEALKNGRDIQFNQDTIYHGKEETLSGIQMRGWGFPRIFSALRHAWYFQVLNRMNEAVGIDYINPLRVITPAPRGGLEGGDPMAIRHMGAFTQTIISVLEARRRDPTIWHVSPFPLDYKVIGGDGRILAPRELLEQALEILLSSLNIPIELYRGTLRLEAAPVALRLFEVSWSNLTSSLNKFLDWLSIKLHKLLEWDRVKLRLAKPSHSEDINKILARLRLMETGRISQTTALQPLGIDTHEETRRMLEEQLVTAQQAIETEKKLKSLTEGQEKIQNVLMNQQMAMSGMEGVGSQMPIGGLSAMPVAGGSSGADFAAVIGDPVAQMLAMIPTYPGQQLNPTEIERLANTLAQQLFGQSETVRTSFLRQLRNKNEILWMSVKTKLEEMLNSARRQGVDMARQQYAQMATQMPPIMG